MVIVLCVYPASTWIQINFYSNPDGVNFKACSMKLAPATKQKKEKEKFEGFAAPGKSIGLLS